MQRYELSDGTSNKFWAIERTATGYKVTFGRIGTNGQTQVKEFGDAATAQKEHDKLVAEKVKKGYALVGAQTTPVPAPTVRKPAAPAPAPAAAAAPVAAAAPAPATAPRIAGDAAEIAKRAAAERKALVVTPTASGDPAKAYAALHAELLTRGKTSIQNGAAFGDPEAKRLGNLVLKDFGISKLPTSLSLESAAAALALIPHAEQLGAFLVAQYGLAFAISAFAHTAWNLHPTTIGTSNREGVALMPAADRDLGSLLGRPDRALAALWLGASDADRDTARPALEALRTDSPLLQRSMIACATLEQAWIDADLAEHARSGGRAVFSSEALLRARDPRHLAGYFAGLSDRDAAAHGLATQYHYRTELNRWTTGFAWVEAFGLGGIDIAIARVRRILPTLVGDSYQFSRIAQEVLHLLEVVALAVSYPPAVTVAIAVVERVNELKFSKQEDPEPRALEIINASPAVALPLLQPIRKQWAKDLVPRLSRLSGAAPTDARAEGTAPAALTGRKFKAPEFWQPAALPRLAMRDGTLYPVAHLDSLGAVLAADDRAAIAQLRDLADRDSLAQLGWELFQLWLAGGAESKHKWGFLQLGQLGNDETARRLAPLIRAWPGESQHKRAVNGLDVLGEIGSDVALMMLDGIAQKVKFKGLQENARAKMGEIAAKRGITAEQLSDRLVPDLELEDDGSKTLDFGPRSFRVGFDEHLAPFVIDASGARLRELPKPNSKDDPALSAAAVETWKAMKKDVRALAGIQLERLELGMGNARRWRGDELRTFFVEHPLMTHLARRLVWGVYAPELTRTFRVAEDRSYASVGDDAFELADDAIVGIVHRYDLPDEDADAWSRLFADYELVQPFEQLTRAVYRLADDETPHAQLTRFEGRVVPTRALLKLLSRGWRKGAAVDNGSIYELVKPISAELSAQLAFETGLNAGGMEYVDPTQTLQFVDFASSVPYYGKRQDAVVIGALPPVIVSEVIRDIETLESVPDEEEA